MKPNTKVIYFEALSNPLLELADIPAIAEYAHAHGCKVIVDNTFVSPFIMRPLDWGADIVIHSATKYYVGHGDAICGVLAGKKLIWIASAITTTIWAPTSAPLIPGWLSEASARCLCV